MLTATEAPIVLLPRAADGGVAESVAPDNPRLGVMLRYTPVHHLLMQAIDFPVVATSGNLSDEPICIDNNEALERLELAPDPRRRRLDEDAPTNAQKTDRDSHGGLPHRWPALNITCNCLVTQ